MSKKFDRLLSQAKCLVPLIRLVFSLLSTFCRNTRVSRQTVQRVLPTNVEAEIEIAT